MFLYPGIGVSSWKALLQAQAQDKGAAGTGAQASREDEMDQQPLSLVLKGPSEVGRKRASEERARASPSKKGRREKAATREVEDSPRPARGKEKVADDWESLAAEVDGDEDPDAIREFSPPWRPLWDVRESERGLEAGHIAERLLEGVVLPGDHSSVQGKTEGTAYEGLLSSLYSVSLFFVPQARLLFFGFILTVFSFCRRL